MVEVELPPDLAIGQPHLALGGESLPAVHVLLDGDAVGAQCDPPGVAQSRLGEAQVTADPGGYQSDLAVDDRLAPAEHVPRYHQAVRVHRDLPGVRYQRTTEHELATDVGMAQIHLPLDLAIPQVQITRAFQPVALHSRQVALIEPDRARHAVGDHQRFVEGTPLQQQRHLEVDTAQIQLAGDPRSREKHRRREPRTLLVLLLFVDGPLANQQRPDHFSPDVALRSPQLRACGVILLGIPGAEIDVRAVGEFHPQPPLRFGQVVSTHLSISIHDGDAQDSSLRTKRRPVVSMREVPSMCG
ncbi:MAG: hypothetical protein ACRDTH_05955 [Pseudonocardiaceae bacterium]